MKRVWVGLVLGLVVGAGWAGMAQETPLTPIANLRGRTNASGYLLVALSPSPAPTGAQYWVGAADGDLTGELNLGVLATGLVISTLGQPSIYAGSSTCTGTQAVQTLSALGVATCITTGGAPTDAQYWTGAADGTLSAEKNLGALSTALVINTAGVPSAYAGVTCTNQFLRVLSAIGGGTCADVTLTTDTAGNYTASVAGTTDRVAVSGAVGEGQAAVIDIAAAYVGQTSIVTLGTVTTGVWTGTAIAWANGGTGLTTAADDTTLISSGSAWVATAVSNCTDTGGNHLNYTASTNSFSCGTSSSGGGAPTDATYITQTADGTLSAEQALSALSSGIMRVATTTGVITSLTDSAGIAANISDETGTGVLVFGTSPTFTTSIITSLMVANVTNIDLRSATSDASDTGIVRMNGGGSTAVDATRGAQWAVTGNEEAGQYGNGFIYGKLGETSAAAFQVQRSASGAGSNIIKINGVDKKTYLPGVYDNTTVSVANVEVDSDGLMLRSTSSARYKDQILDLAPDTWHALRLLRPRTFVGKNDTVKKVHMGFVAEEMNRVLPMAVDLDETQQPMAIEYAYLTSILTQGWQAHDTQIRQLAACVKTSNPSQCVAKLGL